jgi:hypothetical protein
MNSEKELLEAISLDKRKQYLAIAKEKYPELLDYPSFIDELPLNKKIEPIEKFLFEWCEATKTERLIAFNGAGDLIVDAYGERTSVPILEEEIELLKNAKAIAIHCHITDVEDGKIETFSPGDIGFIYDYGVKESRIVCGHAIYVWRRDKRIKKSIVFNKLGEILALLKKKELTPEQYQNINKGPSYRIWSAILSKRT